ncbi:MULTISPECIES: 50S ribosomal protein L18 [unclassified Wenzhouxiangella]|uniref:50S ribosomal protein L18 n=1 Tax=unclassified Wenzhouxiangella TaxID=2613841 RepID=UPI000E327482|nr:MULTISPECIES: 50S ribosomal protein L18 [unclassified Wenzhouxiangella]RFF26460.1 50S ribosomal protein L18 [Wenzhouxiangella sp. 15181]RFP67267.1 50S ribosomal protein L18 [Wenzhouxiangella sp. 15190]
MKDKNQSRLRRARKNRARITRSSQARLSVHRSGQHIYAQIIASGGQHTIASASTLQKDVAEGLKSTCSVEAAQAVGKKVAERGLEAGVEGVAFDRSGFRYHGRVKALADAAREAGLKF